MTVDANWLELEFRAAVNRALTATRQNMKLVGRSLCNYAISQKSFSWMDQDHVQAVRAFAAKDQVTKEFDFDKIATWIIEQMEYCFEQEIVYIISANGHMPWNLGVRRSISNSHLGETLVPIWPKGMIISPRISLLDYGHISNVARGVKDEIEEVGYWFEVHWKYELTHEPSLPQFV